MAKSRHDIDKDAKQRKLDKGLTRVDMWVPKKYEEDFRRYGARLRALGERERAAELEIARKLGQGKAA